MGSWGGIVALLLALAVFAAGARARWRWVQLRERRPHSPVDGAFVRAWVSWLVRGETDPDTDTEPDTGRRRGKRYVEDSDTHTTIEYFDLDKDALPLAMPTSGRAEPQLHVWIRRSFEEGAKYSDVVRDGRRLFGKSEPTIKRAIKQVRERQARR